MAYDRPGAYATMVGSGQHPCYDSNRRTWAADHADGRGGYVVFVSARSPRSRACGRPKRKRRYDEARTLDVLEPALRRALVDRFPQTPHIESVAVLERV